MWQRRKQNFVRDPFVFKMKRGGGEGGGGGGNDDVMKKERERKKKKKEKERVPKPIRREEAFPFFFHYDFLSS